MPTNNENLMDYDLIAKNAKEFFILIQQKGGSLEDISYEDKKKNFCSCSKSFTQ